jgi:hypothetical protein
MTRYPPHYHYRAMYEALSRYQFYSASAADEARYSRKLREKGNHMMAAAFQRLSAKKYEHARIAHNTFIAQKPLAEKERQDAQVCR